MKKNYNVIFSRFAEDDLIEIIEYYEHIDEISCALDPERRNWRDSGVAGSARNVSARIMTIDGDN